jgi:SAM-dependent methyltransferase
MLESIKPSTRGGPHIRPCPLCGSDAASPGYPYATEFNSKHFGYHTCGKCKSVFVDPIPDTDTFSKMYAQHEYHDRFYQQDNSLAEYRASAKLLSKQLEMGSRVLDYGCGMGHFLIALREQGFTPFGVEFDPDAATAAASRTGCEVISVDAFFSSPIARPFDAIHLGDVLEHLPDPATTVSQLIACLRPGGLLYAEGPLERNASPVFWARSVIGVIKRRLKPGFTATHPPTRLYFTGSQQQFAFFSGYHPS